MEVSHMAIAGISNVASSVLMEKALSTQNKANKLEQLDVPLEDGATKQLGAKDMAAIAKAVQAKSVPGVNSDMEKLSSATKGKLDLKA